MELERRGCGRVDTGRLRQRVCPPQICARRDTKVHAVLRHLRLTRALGLRIVRRAAQVLHVLWPEDEPCEPLAVAVSRA